jgi:hypothetical protein
MPQMEQVLNKPLSGTEVRKIILSKLEQALAGDTRLSDYIAFPSFQFRLDLAILLTGAVHDKINKTIESRAGEPDNPDAPVQAVTHHLEQSPMPPNEARIDAGMGIPILTRDEKGREIEKEVKYSREARNLAKGE